MGGRKRERKTTTNISTFCARRLICGVRSFHACSGAIQERCQIRSPFPATYCTPACIHPPFEPEEINQPHFLRRILLPPLPAAHFCCSFKDGKSGRDAYLASFRMRDLMLPRRRKRRKLSQKIFHSEEEFSLQEGEEDLLGKDLLLRLLEFLLLLCDLLTLGPGVDLLPPSSLRLSSYLRETITQSPQGCQSASQLLPSALFSASSSRPRWL